MVAPLAFLEHRDSTSLNMPDSPAVPAKKARKDSSQVSLDSVCSDRIYRLPISKKNKYPLTKYEKCNLSLCYNDRRNCLKEIHEFLYI